ncbi:MAG TPA: acyltransferase [Stellaceae bacterium]|nr:acyltransferase [Stellaceae bacterium]
MKGKIGDIQILRAVAIMLVLLQHLTITEAVFHAWKIPLDMSFYLGVDLLFVVSGYIVTTSMYRDGFNVRSFFVKRVFRLYPALLAFLALSFAVYFLFRHAPISSTSVTIFQMSKPVFWQAVLAVLTGTYTLEQPPGYSFQAIWSLSVEFQFYGAMAVLCGLLGLFPRLDRRSVFSAVAALCGLIWLVISLNRFYLLSSGGFLNFGDTIAYLTNWKFDFLMVGVLVAYLKTKIALPEASIRWVRAALPLVCLIAPLILVGRSGSPFAPIAEARLLNGPALFVTGLAFALLVWLASDNRAFQIQTGVIHRSLMAIGERSYTLYLVHFPVLALAWAIIQTYAPWTFSYSALSYGIAQVAVGACLIVPITEGILRLLERPGIQIGHSLVKPPEPRLATAVVGNRS